MGAARIAAFFIKRTAYVFAFIVYCYFILNNINICKKYMQEMLVFIAVGVEEFDYFFFGR